MSSYYERVTVRTAPPDVTARVSVSVSVSASWRASRDSHALQLAEGDSSLYNACLGPGLRPWCSAPRRRPAPAARARPGPCSASAMHTRGGMGGGGLVFESKHKTYAKQNKTHERLENKPPVAANVLCAHRWSQFDTNTGAAAAPCGRGFAGLQCAECDHTTSFRDGPHRCGRRDE